MPLFSLAMEPIAPIKHVEEVSFEHMAPEIHQQILLNLVEGHTAQEAIQNILAFTRINKAFASFLNDEHTNKLLIQKLAEKYFNNNQIKAAQALNTTGARKWFADYLAQGKQQKQEVLSPLFAALTAKDNKAVVNLINAGLDANTRDKKLAKTPLMVAAHNGDLVLMDFLISKGAAVDSSDKQGNTPLLYAIRNNKINAVQFLLDKGALIDAQNSAGFTPLMWAIHRRQPEIAKLLLDKNANITLTDNQGVTALMESAAHNLPEIGRLLIAKGADVNTVDSQEYSALLDAAGTAPELLPALLRAGANPLQITTDGLNILMIGAANPEVLRLLLSTPARTLLDVTDNLGWRALTYAIINGNPEAVKVLLQAGANPNKLHTETISPVAHAIGKEEIIQLLNEYINK